MKRLILILFTVSVLLLCACNNSEKDPDDVTPPPPITDNTEQNGDPDDMSNPYNADDIKIFMQDKYDAAREAFFWFNVASMPPQEKELDYINMTNIKEVDGLYYYKVKNDTIKNLSGLEDYLKSLFSDEIVNGIFNTNSKDDAGKQYIDINGELWATDFARGTDIFKGEAIFSIGEKTDTKIVCNVDVEDLAENNGDMEVVGITTYKYTYEKKEAGWRWTEFSIYD